MKVKACPKCGNTSLGERWCKGRMLQHYCSGEDGETSCWVSQPYTPPKRRITNTTEFRLDEFVGWHYLVYDKYGHVATDSATYDTRAEAMVELTEDITPKEGYDDPAAPFTAVLFNVPPRVTIKGTMFKFKKGKVTEVSPRVKKSKSV